MAVDPYVPNVPADAPRSKEKVPPARGWRAVRPGDLGPNRPHGRLLGTPAPDAGYALLLAERFRDSLDLAWQEHADDALAVATAIAQRRAGLFGRAPVAPDIDFALTLLGYRGGAPEDLVAWRREQARDARHDYARQRAVADAVLDTTLRLNVADVRNHRLGSWRSLVRVDG